MSALTSLPNYVGRACAALLLLCLALPAWAAPDFPKLAGRVTDAADVIPAAEEAQLDSKLANLEARTGRQLVVATVPDLQGFEIEEYGYQLGRAWGIGEAATNSGAILLVAPNERRVRVEVGYGLEGILTDGLSGQIIRREIVPRFKDGDMPGGIAAGTDALIAQLDLPDDQARAVAAEASAEPQGDSLGIGGIVWLLIICFWIIPSILRRGFGKKYRSRGGGAPIVIWGPGSGGGSSGWGGGGGGGGFGGFSGGGGGFGGGGASGGW